MESVGAWFCGRGPRPRRVGRRRSVMQPVVSLGEIALRCRGAPGMGVAYALLPRIVREIMPVAADAARATVPLGLYGSLAGGGPEAAVSANALVRVIRLRLRICYVRLRICCVAAHPRSLGKCDRPVHGHCGSHQRGRPERYACEALPSTCGGRERIPRLPRKSHYAGRCATFRPDVSGEAWKALRESTIRRPSMITGSDLQPPAVSVLPRPHPAHGPELLHVL